MQRINPGDLIGVLEKEQRNTEGYYQNNNEGKLPSTEGRNCVDQHCPT